MRKNGTYLMEVGCNILSQYHPSASGIFCATVLIADLHFVMRAVIQPFKFVHRANDSSTCKTWLALSWKGP